MGSVLLGKGADASRRGPDPPPDGFYVETEVEYFSSVNGAELRPEGGGWLTGRFQDYVGLYEPCDVR